MRCSPRDAVCKTFLFLSHRRRRQLTTRRLYKSKNSFKTCFEQVKVRIWIYTRSSQIPTLSKFIDIWPFSLTQRHQFDPGLGWSINLYHVLLIDMPLDRKKKIDSDPSPVSLTRRQNENTVRYVLYAQCLIKKSLKLTLQLKFNDIRPFDHSRGPQVRSKNVLWQWVIHTKWFDFMV